MSGYADPEAIEQHIADVIPLARASPSRAAAEEVIDFAEGVSAPPAAPSGPGELPEHLLAVPGLVGHITRWMTKTAMYPQPSLALAAALTVVGTAAGRKYAGPTRSGTHLYTLAIAPTGAGKNHAPKLAKRLMRAANMDELMGPGQFMSESAVYQFVAKQPLMVCFMDEFGSYLQRINNPKSGDVHAKAISGVLRSFWGASFDTVNPPAWASKDALKPIHSPALSIYGMSVHEEFYQALQSADIANGFLNRFLIFSTRNKPEEVDPELDEDTVPSALVDWLQRIAQPTGNPRQARRLEDGWAAEIKMDWAAADARLHYKAFRKSMEDRGDDAKLLSRVPELAVRLASIRSIGCAKGGPCSVSEEDIRWGAELAAWSAERMISDANAYMVESEHQGRTKEVLRWLEAAPAGRMTHTELSRKVKAKFDARTLRSILDSLVDSDLIEITRERGEGSKKPTDHIRFLGGMK